MCTNIVHCIDIDGSGKTSLGWMPVTAAAITYDHPTHATVDHAINIDFVNPSATMSYGGTHLSALGGVSYRRSAPYSNGRGELMTQAANYQASAMDSDAFRATTLWGRSAWRSTSGHQVEASYTR